MHLWEMSLAPCGTLVHSCYHFYSLTSISREMTRVPKLFSRRGWKTRSQPFWGDFTLFEELFANPYFLLWIFCTYREALTSIWLSTLWINSVGFFGCFASESPTHKTGQMSFGPGAPLRSALICTDARMAAPHNMLSLNVQWMIAPRGVVYLGQYSVGSGQFNLHKCL